MDHSHHHNHGMMINNNNDDLVANISDNNESSMNMAHDMNMNAMKMYFHVGYEPIVLLKQWAANSDAKMFGTILCFFLIAIIYEWLKFYRQKHLLNSIKNHRVIQVIDVRTGISDSRDQRDCTSGCLNDNQQINSSLKRAAITFGINKRFRMLLSKVHLVQTLLHILQYFLSYVLMLAFMLFNIWICLAILIGAGIGFWSFGWDRQQSLLTQENEEHCH